MDQFKVTELSHGGQAPKETLKVRAGEILLVLRPDQRNECRSMVWTQSRDSLYFMASGIKNINEFKAGRGEQMCVSHLNGAYVGWKEHNHQAKQEAID